MVLHESTILKNVLEEWIAEPWQRRDCEHCLSIVHITPSMKSRSQEVTN